MKVFKWTKEGKHIGSWQQLMTLSDEDKQKVAMLDAAANYKTVNGYAVRKSLVACVGWATDDHYYLDGDA